MGKLMILIGVVGLWGCGTKKPPREIPPCKYKSQWNETRCGVSMYQDPETKVVFAQPGEIRKVRTKENSEYTLPEQDACFILPRGATFSKNFLRSPQTGDCAFQIEPDASISAEGALVNDGYLPN